MEDDEIVIGIDTRKQISKNTNNKNKKGKKNKKSKNSSTKLPVSKTRINAINSKSSKTSQGKNTKKRNPKIKIFAILVLIICLTILILSSSLFNIKEINVEGNKKLSDDKVISLSKLEIYTNIFRFNKIETINNTKQNAYIENVSISRKLPSTIDISIKERVATYMLQFADSYVYINNQGYMLEISNEKLDVPILIGFTTDLSNIKAGNRINEEDLKKMNMVIKIYEIAKSNDLNNLITKIDISNPKNYTIILENEEKIVYLGNCSESDLNTKMLYLKSILEASKGRGGEIFLNVDLNSEDAYVRWNVE